MKTTRITFLKYSNNGRWNSNFYLNEINSITYNTNIQQYLIQRNENKLIAKIKFGTEVMTTLLINV